MPTSKKPKRSMQNVSFQSLDEFFDFLPPSQLKIVQVLRTIVLECIPDAQEKLSYNVPFYRRRANICFIWPSAITWGGVKQQGVRLGLTSGHLLKDDSGYFEQGNRKQVCWRDFLDVKEIDVELLKAYLYEALIIDQEKVAVKGKKKSS